MINDVATPTDLFCTLFISDCCTLYFLQQLEASRSHRYIFTSYKIPPIYVTSICIVLERITSINASIHIAYSQSFISNISCYVNAPLASTWVLVEAGWTETNFIVDCLLSILLMRKFYYLVIYNKYCFNN